MQNRIITNIITFFKNELMLCLSIIAALISLLITPPTKELLSNINWHTLGVLLMMLCVLCGFKKENVFLPITRFSLQIKKAKNISFFLVFAVFFSSMFVTNDISLLVFVPLTILIFKNAQKEQYIIPILVLENIAAIRGSLLMPFGSPQNIFFFEKTQTSALNFILHMFPLSAASALLLVCAILIIHKNDSEARILTKTKTIEENTENQNTFKKLAYLMLFAIVVWTIVSHTRFWYISVVVVLLSILLIDRKIFLEVDYSLLITFLCFFVFSSSIALNQKIAQILKNLVSGYEYWWVIALSQAISNVPATIVLYPFSSNLTGLIYGADTAGLVSLIGSLASIITYRIYKKEYPAGSKAFLKSFTLISWIFFMIMVFPTFILSKVWGF